MDKLTERALEMCDSLIHCAVGYGIYACRQCALLSERMPQGTNARCGKCNREIDR